MKEIVLRPYQEEAVDAIFTYFEKNTGNPIVALPTGTGKSILIAEFIRRSLSMYPKTKIMMLTHVKELIQQNFEALIKIWPSAPAGIFSAGLSRKDAYFPLTFAGIASVAKKADLFKHQDLLLIDECHLVSDKGSAMYVKFIKQLKKYNPALKVIGFTATQYRLGLGLLTGGKIFTDICFDLTGKESFQRLIAEGFMSPLVTKKTVSEFDVSNVKLTAGEYNLKHLQVAVNQERITQAAVTEAIKYGLNRQSWLVFTSGIEHSEAAADILNQNGIKAAAVHSKIPGVERDRIITAFKRGEYQAVTNNNVLTTGFDYPEIDLIMVLRPTKSTGLWVQMLGRGTRPAPEKENCLVMDFAGNTKRLGAIDDPVIPKKSVKLGNGSAPVKVCENCSSYQHISVRVCKECGFSFVFLPKIFKSAASTAVMNRPDEINEYQVVKVKYKKHHKEDRPPSFRIIYECDDPTGTRLISEWLCFEHAGWPKKKAKEFWEKVTGGEPPKTVDEALARKNILRTPQTIKVWEKANFPEILERCYSSTVKVS